MTGSTFSEQFKEEFKAGPRGDLFTPLFEILERHGLKAHGSANSHTLLFKWTDNSGEKHNLIAFRKRPSRVVSFPKSYWQSRNEQVGALLQAFELNEKRSPVAGDPSSKESFKEVLLGDKTLEKLKAMCDQLCEYAKSQGLA